MIATRVSEAVLGEACHRLPIGVFIVDSTLTIQFWNHWLSDHTGLAQDEVESRTLRELFPQSSDLARYETAAQQTITTQAPQLLSQVGNSFLIPVEVPHLERFGVKYMQQTIHVEPLVDEGTTLAMVCITDVTESNIRIAELKELTDKLAEDSNHDPLTGVYNRRFLWEWLDKQRALAVRQAFPISCLLLDCNNISQLAEQYGPQTRDTLLRDMVGVLLAFLRQSDVIVRYGEHTFAILLAYCEPEHAQQVADRLQGVIAEQSLAELPAGQVTCRIGVAAWDPHNPCSGKALLEQAEQALAVS